MASKKPTPPPEPDDGYNYSHAIPKSAFDKKPTSPPKKGEVTSQVYDAIQEDKDPLRLTKKHIVIEVLLTLFAGLIVALAMAWVTVLPVTGLLYFMGLLK